MKKIEFREARRALKLTQTGLAEEMGVQQSKISAWESGERKIPPYIEKHIKILENNMKKHETIEKLRKAAIKTTETNGGKYGNYYPGIDKTEHDKIVIWQIYNNAYINLVNQVHEGLELTHKWNSYPVHCSSSGEDTKNAAKNILTEAGFIKKSQQ